MKKLKTVAALLLFAALITGCATVASVKLVDNKSIPEGLILSMPYGLVKVTFDYELFLEKLLLNSEGEPSQN